MIFRAKARLAPTKTWKDVLIVLHSRLFTVKSPERFASVRVITFACSDFAGLDLGSISVEDYAHGYEHVQLDFLKCLLPMNHAILSKLLEITFEANLPGRQQHDQRYAKHPTNLKFLAETITMPLDTNKRLWAFA